MKSKQEDLSKLTNFFSKSNSKMDFLKFPAPNKLSYPLLLISLMQMVKVAGADSVCFSSDTGSVNKLVCLGSQSKHLSELLFQVCGISPIRGQCILGGDITTETFGHGTFAGSVCKLTSWGEMSVCDVDVLTKYTKNNYGTPQDILATVVLGIVGLILSSLLVIYFSKRLNRGGSANQPVSMPEARSWFYSRLYNRNVQEMTASEQTSLLVKHSL